MEGCSRGGGTLKVSLDFKKLTTKEYKLTAKERLLVIVTVGMMALGITVYISPTDVPGDTAPETTATVAKQATTETPLAATAEQQSIPVTVQKDANRDPFAKPPEATTSKSPPSSSVPPLQSKGPKSFPTMTPKNTAPSNAPQQNFKLTGIVSSAGRSMAVIMSGSQSRSYDINDMIGTYRLKAINGDNVVLANANNNIVLRLESVARKEGKANEK